MYEGEARFCPKDGSPLVDVGSSGKAAAVHRSEQRTVAREVVPRKQPPIDKAASLTGHILDHRYKIERRLGEGGMAYVYEATDLHTGSSLAIKVLSPKLSRDHNSVERLRREAGLAMRLDHPNVCRILRLGETEEDLIYLVMPYLKGELLADRETTTGPMDPEVGVEYLVQMCAGLDFAHRQNIIHRDLKPENVMLVPTEQGGETAVVMDFGLAKQNRADPSMAKLTATGIILGTPEFMSPEQIRGKAIDARSDIYGLGVMAFEMFTARLPFEGRTPQEMMIARLRGKPTPLRRYRRDFPAKLEAVLMRSLASDPDDRYGTAREFGVALIEATEGVDTARLRQLLG
ncbi:MAG: serine/threonine protein kinase [Gemmatimonadota bacterium]|nr:MAG: serine/threonine protein kinase [Gemmatimonadota bacterium]